MKNLIIISAPSGSGKTTLCRALQKRDGSIRFSVSCTTRAKRKGEIDGVEQLTRYLDYLNRDPLIKPVRGVFAAQEIRPQAKVLAEDRGIQCVVIDYDEIRGIESNRLRLF